MEQARHYVCKECSTPVPSGHKFCGRCGAVVPPQILDLRTDFFGAMQSPGKARLILDPRRCGHRWPHLPPGMARSTWPAGATGRSCFRTTPGSARATRTSCYRGDKLVVRDEGSLNGVYLRVRGQVALEPGDSFLCGEQVFRLDRTPADTAGPDPDNTYFYTSPRRPSAVPREPATARRWRGHGGLRAGKPVHASGARTATSTSPKTSICRPITRVWRPRRTGSFALIDNNSKNGTYQRLRGEKELSHGDYLFLGRQLLRVEITA